MAEIQLYFCKSMSKMQNRIEVIKGDITKIEVDCIVNAANTSLLGGGGVDGAIHRAGGPEILADCRKIIAKQGGCKVGEAVITNSGRLPSNFVIHTVGPVWNGGNKNESDILGQCYKKSLQLAVENNCHTIAFPSISTGIYKFPKEKAAEVAIATVTNFLQTNDRINKVIFVCYDDENFNILNNQIVISK